MTVTKRKIRRNQPNLPHLAVSTKVQVTLRTALRKLDQLFSGKIPTQHHLRWMGFSSVFSLMTSKKFQCEIRSIYFDIFFVLHNLSSLFFSNAKTGKITPLEGMSFKKIAMTFSKKWIFFFMNSKFSVDCHFHFLNLFIFYLL